MSKKRKRIDPNQLSIAFDQQIEDYAHLKEEIVASPVSRSNENQSFEEACIEIAVAVKQAIRQTNLSREQMVDAINKYFGWSKDRKSKLETACPPCDAARRGGRGNSGKELSIHMFNHFLSKPAEYPMPAFYLFAIQRITESLEPARCLAEAEEAKVISKGEVRQWALGKLDETIMEMQRLKKELRLKR